MSANNQPATSLGEALIDPSTPAENDGLDNEYFDLIVHENMQIVDPADHVYIITGNLGEGQFGHVYSATTTTDDGKQLNLAMKISKSTQDSCDQFEYEAQALSYVCIVFIWILVLVHYATKVFVFLFTKSNEPIKFHDFSNSISKISSKITQFNDLPKISSIFRIFKPNNFYHHFFLKLALTGFRANFVKRDFLCLH